MRRRAHCGKNYVYHYNDDRNVREERKGKPSEMEYRRSLGMHMQSVLSYLVHPHAPNYNEVSTASAGHGMGFDGNFSAVTMRVCL